MADVNHPKTHVEDQDLDGSRTQPESPQHEGIDPLTEGDTMYPSEDTKTISEKQSKKEAATPLENDTDVTANDELSADQEERSAKANTPDAKLPANQKTTKTKKR